MTSVSGIDMAHAIASSSSSIYWARMAKQMWFLTFTLLIHLITQNCQFWTDVRILWGSRVVVPPQGQQAILQELHTTHSGMTKIKALARMHVWWPGLESDIEESVWLCDDCQLNQSNPLKASLSPWNWPTWPWARIYWTTSSALFCHIDWSSFQMDWSLLSYITFI